MVLFTITRTRGTRRGIVSPCSQPRLLGFYRLLSVVFGVGRCIFLAEDTLASVFHAHLGPVTIFFSVVLGKYTDLGGENGRKAKQRNGVVYHTPAVDQDQYGLVWLGTRRERCLSDASLRYFQRET